MKLGELIHSLSGKSGIKADDETLKKILSYPEMGEELPEEFYKPFEQNLLTVESARTNPDVRGPLFGEYAGSVDDTLYKSTQDFGFSDQLKGELKNLPSTKERIKRVSEEWKKQLSELKEKADKPTASKEDHQKYEAELNSLRNEISRLNGESSNIKASYQTQIDNLERTNEEKRRQYALRTYIANKNLVKFGDVPKEITVQNAELQTRQEMSKNNLVFYLDEFDNPILKQRKDGADLEYFVDNKKVQFPDFVDGVLARGKLLQINDPTKNQQIQNGSGAQFTTNTPATPRNGNIANEMNDTLNQLLGMEV